MKTNSQPTLHTVFGKQGAPLFLKGVNLFNKGKHWEAHEVFEDLWRLHEGEMKTLAQGFVQLAAALSYIRKKRFESILYLFEKSAEKLKATSYLLPDVNIPHLVNVMTIAKEEVERLGERGLDKFAASLYPRVVITSLLPRPRKKKEKTRR